MTRDEMIERIEELEGVVASLRSSNQDLRDAAKKASFVLHGGKLVIPEGTEIGYLCVHEGAFVMGDAR